MSIRLDRSTRVVQVPLFSDNVAATTQINAQISSYVSALSAAAYTKGPTEDPDNAGDYYANVRLLLPADDPMGVDVPDPTETDVSFADLAECQRVCGAWLGQTFNGADLIDISDTNLQTLVDAAPIGFHTILEPNKYRAHLVSKDRQLFRRRGTSGVVEIFGSLDISDGVVSWTDNGNDTWSLSSGLPDNTSLSFFPSAVPGGTINEHLFFDGVPQWRVLDVADVGPGRFHFDDTTNTLTIGDDPSTITLIEYVCKDPATGRTRGIGGGDYVTLENIDFVHFVSRTQDQTVERGTDWVLDNVRVLWSVDGIGGGTGGSITQCKTLDCACIGISELVNTLIDRHSSSRNNWRWFSLHCGNLKIAGAGQVGNTLKGGLWTLAIGGAAPNVWFDTCLNGLNLITRDDEGNYVIIWGGDSKGLFVEACKLVHGQYIKAWGNGRAQNVVPSRADIDVDASEDCLIELWRGQLGNQSRHLHGKSNGGVYFDSEDRSPGLLNSQIVDGIIEVLAGAAGQLGGVMPAGGLVSVLPGLPVGLNNVWDRNVIKYQEVIPSRGLFRWQDVSSAGVSHATFQAAPGNPGTNDTVLTGQELTRWGTPVDASGDTGFRRMYAGSRYAPLTHCRGLSVYCDFSEDSSYTESGGNATVIADLTGNGDDFGGGTPPALIAAETEEIWPNEPNQYPFARFDPGNSEHLVKTSAAFPALVEGDDMGLSIAIACNIRSLPATDTLSYLFSIGKNSANGFHGFGLSRPGGAARMASHRVDDAAVSSLVQQTETNEPIETGPQILSWSYTGAEIEMRRNGILVATAAAQDVGALASLTQMALGALVNNGQSGFADYDLYAMALVRWWLPSLGVPAWDLDHYLIDRWLA